MEQANFEQENGNYMVDVSLEGGTGRATIQSPTPLVIKDHQGTLEIQWSSSNYDYMIVDSVTYYPEESQDKSTFEIPVSSEDKQIEVIADTTAMSTPHEISYTIGIDMTSLPQEHHNLKTIGLGALVGVVILSVVGIFLYNRKKKRRNK